MLQEEREFANKQKQDRVVKKQKDEMKKLNKERIKEGKEPIYLKQRDLKNIHLKDKFEQLDKAGKLENFMEKQHEKVDKKRARVK